MSTQRQITKAFCGLIILTSLLYPRTEVRAHQDTQTHARLTIASFLFLDQTYPTDGALFSSTARGLARQGSIDEDNDPWYVNHFYNPKTGEKGFGASETAPARASRLWTNSIQQYRSGHADSAFSNLGHVCHLLQDMTSPAHVHLDVHAGSLYCELDNDDFEVWGYCDDYAFKKILDYVAYTSPSDSQILPRLGIGLQRIFANQPQRPKALNTDPNTAYTFVRGLATNVYDFTSFRVTLRDTFNGNDPGEGELKSMFPSLEETTVPAAWWIDGIGYSEGQCVYSSNPPYSESWWIMPGCSQYYTNFSTVYVVTGEAYIENVGGGGQLAGYDIPDDLKPARYNRTWFKQRYGSITNIGTGLSNVTMLRIYGDVLYSAAVAYGAGLLQAFLDEAIMPKPITDKPTQMIGTSAQLNGRVKPAGEAAWAWFEWGADTNYGSTTTNLAAGSGQALISLNTRIDGLAADTVYHYRMVSSNRYGIRLGTNQTFRTPAILVTGNPPNAWQITDHSDTSGLNYSTNLNTPLQQAAANGWRYTIHSRMVDDFGDTMTMNFLYGLTATRRFLVWWDLDSSGNLTALVEGQSVRVIATNSATLYHTHELIYTNGTATYLFDGAVIASGLAGVDAGTTPAGQIEWGSGSSAGQGQMNFTGVEFEVAASGIVASYHAGTAGAAPNPTSQGWTANPAFPTSPNAYTPISPDFQAYLPLVETLDASEVGLSTARLNGRGDPRGQAAAGWFEWGSNTLYGNATPPRGLGNGFGWNNLSEDLTGLAENRSYHVRLVVSNAFTTVFGADETLITPRTVIITASDVPVPGQFEFEFTGTAGAVYEVLRSTDLATWLPIGEGTESSAGFFEFLDTASPAAGAFYRVRESAP